MLHSASLALLAFASFGSALALADGTLKCKSALAELELSTDIATGDAPSEAFFKFGAAETRISALELLREDGQVVVGGKTVQVAPYDVWSMRKDVVASAFVRPDLKVFAFELSDKNATVKVVAIPNTVWTKKLEKDDEFSHYTFDADVFFYPAPSKEDVRMKCTFDTDL